MSPLEQNGLVNRGTCLLHIGNNKWREFLFYTYICTYLCIYFPVLCHSWSKSLADLIPTICSKLLHCSYLQVEGDNIVECDDNNIRIIYNIMSWSIQGTLRLHFVSLCRNLVAIFTDNHHPSGSFAALNLLLLLLSFHCCLHSHPLKGLRMLMIIVQ